MYYEAQETIISVRFGVMVLNATFNNMFRSCRLRNQFSPCRLRNQFRPCRLQNRFRPCRLRNQFRPCRLRNQFSPVKYWTRLKPDLIISHSKQHYVKKFIIDLRQVDGCSGNIIFTGPYHDPWAVCISWYCHPCQWLLYKYCTLYYIW
jgi:hypothetical protein